jgi:hypothetical protein
MASTSTTPPLTGDGPSSSTSPTARLPIDDCWDYDESSRCLHVRIASAREHLEEQECSSRPQHDAQVLFGSSDLQGVVRVLFNLEKVSELPRELLHRILMAVRRRVKMTRFQTLEIQHARTMTAPNLVSLLQWLRTTKVKEFCLFRDDSTLCVVNTEEPQDIRSLCALSSSFSRKFGVCLLSDAQEATRLACAVCPHEGEQFERLLRVLGDPKFAIGCTEMCNCGLDTTKIEALIDVLSAHHLDSLQSLNLLNNPFDGTGLTKLLEWLPSTSVNELRVRHANPTCAVRFSASFDYDPEECKHFQLDDSTQLQKAARRACLINPLLLCDAIPPAWRAQLPAPDFSEDDELRQWAIEMMDQPITEFALVDVREVSNTGQIFFCLAPRDLSAPRGPAAFISLKKLKRLRDIEGDLFSDWHSFSRIAKPYLLFERWPEAKEWRSLMRCKQTYTEDHRSGGAVELDSSLGSTSFAVLLNGYFLFEWADLLPTDPLRTAAACLLLHDAFPDISFRKLINNDYFKRIQEGLHSQVSADDILIKRIEGVCCTSMERKRERGRRNAAVVRALQRANQHELVGAGREADFIHSYCNAKADAVQDFFTSVGFQILGTVIRNDHPAPIGTCIRNDHPSPKIKFGSAKKPYRLNQKYAEYAADYLSASWPTILHCFKDLFRATVQLEEASVAALERLAKHPAVKFIECRFKKQKSGFSAAYVELEIDGVTLELQAVASIDAGMQSHVWYELTRIKEWEDVVLFYRRHLKLFSDVVLFDTLRPHRHQQADENTPPPTAAGSRK